MPELCRRGGNTEQVVMWLMSVISSVFIMWRCTVIIRRQDSVTAVALLLKIAAGAALGLLYKFYLGGGDTFQYFREGKTIALYLFDHPGSMLSVYFKTLQIRELAEQIVYYDQPRALLFAKFISVCYIFSGGNYWIIGAFLSLVSFECIRRLTEELIISFPGNKRAFQIAFYFLPTFVFWTSGLLKEGPATASLAILLTGVLRFIRLRKAKVGIEGLPVLIALIILWELKYYYAAIAVPVLFALAVYAYTGKKGRVRHYIFPGIFLAGVVLMSFMHYNLSFYRVLQLVHENYRLAVSGGSGSEILYYNFDGTILSFLINMPIALFSGLFRPLIFDVSNVLQVLVAIENLVVLSLLIIALFRTKFNIPLKNPYVLAALIYTVSLAVLLAFAAPNLGTLSRYKEAYWPFFVSLVLLLSLQKKSQTLEASDFH